MKCLADSWRFVFVALVAVSGACGASADSTVSIAPIKIISPAGGEQWMLGSVHTISWDTSGLAGGARLEITLISSAGSRYSFMSVPAASGNYDWTVGLPKVALAPGTYRIEIEDLSSKGCTNSVPARCWQTVGTSKTLSIISSR